jgi:hypothetical protein
MVRSLKATHSSGRTGFGSQPEHGPDFGFSVRTETDGRDMTTTPKPTPTLTAETDTEYRRSTSFFHRKIIGFHRFSVSV